jgi:hypothetical protein
MKAKSFFSGLSLFVIGMVVMLGIEVNARHHNFNHQAGARKVAVIEVGAPLTVSQLIKEGFN